MGREIREAFRPEKRGWSYLAADYSQIELRLLAHLSEDPVLIEAFQAHEDIHTITAAANFQCALERGDERTAASGQNGQFRHHVWPTGFWAVSGH